MSKLTDVNAVPVVEAQVVGEEEAQEAIDPKKLYSLKMGFARAYLRRTDVSRAWLNYDPTIKRYELCVGDFKDRGVILVRDESEALIRECLGKVLAFGDGHATYDGKRFAYPAVDGAVSRFEEVFGRPSRWERCRSWFS